jgi:hypothetical protein
MRLAQISAFAQGLQERGWIIGGNMRVEYRWGAGDLDRFAAGKPHRADRVRDHDRPGGRRLGGKPGAAGLPCEKRLEIKAL